MGPSWQRIGLNKNLTKLIVKNMPYPARKILLISILSLVLAVFVMFTVDQTLSLYFKQPALTWLWLQARAITNIGLSEYYFIAAIGCFIFGKWIRPDFKKMRAFGRDLFF